MSKKFKRVTAALMAMVMLLGSYCIDGLLSTTKAYAAYTEGETVTISNAAEAANVLSPTNDDSGIFSLEVNIIGESEVYSGYPAIFELSYKSSGNYTASNAYLVLEIPDSIDWETAKASVYEAFETSAIAYDENNHMITISLGTMGNTAGSFQINAVFPTEVTDSGTTATINAWLYAEITNNDGSPYDNEYSLKTASATATSKVKTGVELTKTAGSSIGTGAVGKTPAYVVDYAIDITRKNDTDGLIKVGDDGALIIASAILTDTIPTDTNGNPPLKYEYSTDGGSTWTTVEVNSDADLALSLSFTSSNFTAAVDANGDLINSSQEYKLTNPVQIKVYYDASTFVPEEEASTELVNTAEVDVIYLGGNETGYAEGSAEVVISGVTPVSSSAVMVKDDSDDTLDLNALLTDDQTITFPITVTNNGGATINYTIEDLQSSIELLKDNASATVSGLDYYISGVSVKEYSYSEATEIIVNGNSIAQATNNSKVSGSEVITEGSDVKVTITEIPSGKSMTIYVTVTFKKVTDLSSIAGAFDTIKNTAEGYIVNSDESKGAGNEDYGTAGVDDDLPDATITKSASSSNPAYAISDFTSGDTTVSFDIEITGDPDKDIYDVAITDSGLEFLNGSNEYTITGNITGTVSVKSGTATITSNPVAIGSDGLFDLTLDKIEAGATVILTVSYTIPQQGGSPGFNEIKNTVVLTSYKYGGMTIADGDDDNASVTVKNEIGADVDKYVATGGTPEWDESNKISLYDKLYDKGDTISYQIKVSNTGTNATDITLTESGPKFYTEDGTEVTVGYSIDTGSITVKDKDGNALALDTDYTIKYLDENGDTVDISTNPDDATQFEIVFINMPAGEEYYATFDVTLPAYTDGVAYDKVKNTAQIKYVDNGQESTLNSEEVITTIDSEPVEASTTKTHTGSPNITYPSQDLIDLNKLEYTIEATLKSDIALEWYAIYDDGLSFDPGPSTQTSDYAWLESITIPADFLDALNSCGTNSNGTKVYVDYLVGGSWYRVGEDITPIIDDSTSTGYNMVTVTGTDYSNGGTVSNLESLNAESVRVVIVHLPSTNSTPVTFELSVTAGVNGYKLYEYAAANGEFDIVNNSHGEWGYYAGSGGESNVSDETITIGKSDPSVTLTKAITEAQEIEYNDFFSGDSYDLPFTMTATNGLAAASEMVVYDYGLKSTGTSISYKFTEISVTLADMGKNLSYSDVDFYLYYDASVNGNTTTEVSEYDDAATPIQGIYDNGVVTFDLTSASTDICSFYVVAVAKTGKYLPSGLKMIVNATATVYKSGTDDGSTGTSDLDITNYANSYMVPYTTDDIKYSTIEKAKYTVKYSLEVGVDKTAYTTADKSENELNLSDMTSNDTYIYYDIVATVKKDNTEKGTLTITDTAPTITGGTVEFTEIKIKTADVSAYSIVVANSTSTTSGNYTVYSLTNGSEFTITAKGVPTGTAITVTVTAKVTKLTTSKDLASLSKIENKVYAELSFKGHSGKANATAETPVNNDVIPAGLDIKKEAKTSKQNIVELAKGKDIELKYEITGLSAEKNTMLDYVLTDTGISYTYKDKSVATGDSNGYLQFSELVFSSTKATGETLYIKLFNESGAQVGSTQTWTAGTSVIIDSGLGSIAYFTVTSKLDENTDTGVSADFDGTITVTGLLKASALEYLYGKDFIDNLEVNTIDLEKVVNNVEVTFDNGDDIDGSASANAEIPLYASKYPVMELEKSADPDSIGASALVYGTEEQRTVTFTITGINNNSLESVIDELILSDTGLSIRDSNGTVVSNGYTITNITVSRTEADSATSTTDFTAKLTDSTMALNEPITDALVGGSATVNNLSVKDFTLNLTNVPVGMVLEVQLTVVFDAIDAETLSSNMKIYNEANLSYKIEGLDPWTDETYVEVPIVPVEQEISVNKTIETAQGTENYANNAYYNKGQSVNWQVVAYNSFTDEEAGGTSVYIDPVITDNFPVGVFLNINSASITATTYKNYITAIEYGTVDGNGNFTKDDSIGDHITLATDWLEVDSDKITLKFVGNLYYGEAIRIIYKVSVNGKADPGTYQNNVTVSSAFSDTNVSDMGDANDTANITVNSKSEVIIRKQAYGDVNDQLTMSGAYSTAETGGAAYYLLTIANYKETAVTQLGVLDVLPYSQDESITVDGVSRGSTLVLPLKGISEIYYYKNGSDPDAADLLTEGTDYVIYVTTEDYVTNKAEIDSVVKSGSYVSDPTDSGRSAIWTTLDDCADITKVTAFYIYFNQEVIKDYKLQIKVDVTVPEASDPVWAGAYGYGSKIAWNSFAIIGNGVAQTPVESNYAGITSGVAGLGDYVWYDENANGIQDAGESGVSGVTVYLYQTDESGKITGIYGSTVTDTNGYYVFAQIPYGYYKVGFAEEDRFTFTTANANNNTDDYVDSDAEESYTDENGVNVMLTALIDLSKGSKTQEGSYGIDPSWDAGVILKDKPSLTITKNVLNANGDVIGVNEWADSYSFKVTITSNKGYSNIVTLTKDNPSVTLRDLEFATYTIKESNTGGLSFISLVHGSTTSADNGAGISVTLSDYEQTEAVVISNKLPSEGELTITKRVLNSSNSELASTDWNSSYSFTVSVSSNTGYSNTITLTKSNPSVTLYGLALGTYTVTETNTGGLGFVSIVSDGKSGDDRSISVDITSNATYADVVVTNRETDTPTSSEPTTSEPTSSEPTSSEPTSSEPTSSEPTSSEPPAPESETTVTVDEEPIPLANGYTAVPLGDNEYMILDENGIPLGTITVPEGTDITEIDLSELIPLGNLDIPLDSDDNPKTGDEITGKAFILIVVAGALALLITKRRKTA